MVKKNTHTYKDRNLRDLWKKIYRQLPQDRRQWYYDMSSIMHLRSLIDKLTMEYIYKYHSDEYAQFQKLLMQQQSVYEKAYGKQSSYQDFAVNKMNDLYKRMGNVILSEMREFNKLHISLQNIEMQQNEKEINSSLQRLKIMLNKAFKEKMRNQYEYENLEADIEYM